METQPGPEQSWTWLPCWCMSKEQMPVMPGAWDCLLHSVTAAKPDCYIRSRWQGWSAGWGWRGLSHGARTLSQELCLGFRWWLLLNTPPPPELPPWWVTISVGRCLGCSRSRGWGRCLQHCLSRGRHRRPPTGAGLKSMWCIVADRMGQTTDINLEAFHKQSGAEKASHGMMWSEWHKTQHRILFMGKESCIKSVRTYTRRRNTKLMMGDPQERREGRAWSG